MAKKTIACVAVFILCLSIFASATADMKRGSRGEDVQTVQEMLIELGFLEDKADGIFGKKTAAAVKRFQAYLGEKQNGILKDDQEFVLWDLSAAATGMGEGDGRDEEELMESYPGYCSWEGKDEWGGVFCYRHLEESFIHSKLEKGNMPSRLENMLMKRLCEAWTQDILAMYDAWEEELAEEDSHIAEEQREIFENKLEEYQSAESEPDGLLNEQVWLEKTGIDLCFDMHGAESN